MATELRRAVNLSLIGLVAQAVFAGLLLLIGLWSNSLATLAAARFSVIGVLIWLPVSLVLYQRKLAQEESLEAEQIRRERESAGQPVTGLFDERGELILARNRLQVMQRFLLPTFGLLTAAILILGSLLWWTWPLGAGLSDRAVWGTAQNASQSAAFLAGIAFLGFLLSRYGSGLAKAEGAPLLRAGSSYMMGTAMASGALAIVLACVHFNQPVPERVAAYVIRLAMLLVGAEIALNLILDFYRPRKPGEEPRAAFDSRLLNLLSETTGLAQTISEAFDYQFGIPISRTWAYQLLSRAMVPLIAFAVLSVLALSMIVVVHPGEQAIVERWGEPLQDVTGGSGALQPGLHLKWPWPIDRVYRYPIEQVQQVWLGLDLAHWDEEAQAKDVVLWSDPKHFGVDEFNLLVAVPPSEAEKRLEELSAEGADEDTGRAVPVAIIQAAVTVQYRVRENELYKYVYNYQQPGRVLQSAGYRELAEMASTIDLSTVFGPGRSAAKEELMRRLQRRADELELGIDIVFVGLQGVHPSSKVAEAFEQVVQAEIDMETTLQKAQAEANTTLAEVVGDERLARTLAERLVQIETFRDEPDPSEEQIDGLTAEAEQLFYGAGRSTSSGRRGEGSGVRGTAAQRVAEAEAWKQQKVNRVRGEVETFRQELLAYRKTPYLYVLRRYLETIQEAVRDMRKFVIAVPTRGPIIWELRDEPSAPGLGDIAGISSP